MASVHDLKPRFRAQACPLLDAANRVTAAALPFAARALKEPMLPKLPAALAAGDITAPCCADGFVAEPSPRADERATTARAPESEVAVWK